MAKVIQKRSSSIKLKSISKAEISRRLVDLDLAQTSALRDLEMDISGEAGLDSKKIMAKARMLIR